MACLFEIESWLARTSASRIYAVLTWPDVVFFEEEEPDCIELYDTVIQITNLSTESVLAHCFYENANSHCTNSGDICSGEIEPDDGIESCCDPSKS